MVAVTLWKTMAIYTIGQAQTAHITNTFTQVAYPLNTSTSICAYFFIPNTVAFATFYTYFATAFIFTC